jgi:hypothetical protein
MWHLAPSTYCHLPVGVDEAVLTYFQQGNILGKKGYIPVQRSNIPVREVIFSKNFDHNS